MNFNLFLIILIALIIIFLIILYNGIRLLLTVEKEKGIVKYEFKVTILKIAIFTRKGTKEIIDSIRSKKDKDSEEEEEESKSEENEEKSESEGEEDEDKKGLKEKYEEIKPILKDIVNSSKPTQLSVEPRFNEVITDFEGKIELKINILLLLIHSLTLLTKKNIRELIKELYRQKKSKDNAKNESINDNEQKTKK